MVYSRVKAVAIAGDLWNLVQAAARFTNTVLKWVLCGDEGRGGGAGARMQPHGQHGGRRQHPRLVLRSRLAPRAAGQVRALALPGCIKAPPTVASMAARGCIQAVQQPACAMLHRGTCMLHAPLFLSAVLQRNQGAVRARTLNTSHACRRQYVDEATSLVERHTFEVACLTWNVNESRPDPGTGLHRWVIDLAKEASLFVVALQEIESGGGSLALAAAKDALLTKQQASLRPACRLRYSLQRHEAAVARSRGRLYCIIAWVLKDVSLIAVALLQAKGGGPVITR